MLFITLFAIVIIQIIGFQIADYAHYTDFFPYRQEGLSTFDDFRTAMNPPLALRNRKMEIGQLKITVEEVLSNPIWPTRWPYVFEDFRPLDYTRDEIFNTGRQYSFSQSLIENDFVTLIPGIFRIPIKRHFIYPKDKFALSEHMEQYFFPGAKVLELFSCYESILPEKYTRKSSPLVGVGWSEAEMKCNPLLDDFIEQDITVDPFLPLADNYFDFVIIPANFQLFQRPLEMFQEINRVLKPGGMVFVGVKLVHWSFLSWKQGRYFVETNYLEDVLALGSFFHYAEGFSKIESFDLTLPEVTTAGKVKDWLCPSPRMDFYACVQAKKKKNSPHGKDTIRTDEDVGPVVEGLEYRPKMYRDSSTGIERPGPYY